MEKRVAYLPYHDGIEVIIPVENVKEIKVRLSEFAVEILKEEEEE